AGLAQKGRIEGLDSTAVDEATDHVDLIDHDGGALDELDSDPFGHLAHGVDPDSYPARVDAAESTKVEHHLTAEARRKAHSTMLFQNAGEGIGAVTVSLDPKGPLRHGSSER